MVCAWCVSSRVCVQCQVRRVCYKYRSPGSICATRSYVCSFRSSELAGTAAWRVCARVCMAAPGRAQCPYARAPPISLSSTIWLAEGGRPAGAAAVYCAAVLLVWYRIWRRPEFKAGLDRRMHAHQLAANASCVERVGDDELTIAVPVRFLFVESWHRFF